MVCVPVRDEEKRLPALFDALSRQTQVAFGHWRLCLFLDGCRDESGAVARRLAHAAPFEAIIVADASVREANAGRARRAAMAQGLRRLRAPCGLILSTDADCRPAPDWIARSRQALDAADVVAGRIVRRAGADGGGSRPTTTDSTACGGGSTRSPGRTTRSTTTPAPLASASVSTPTARWAASPPSRPARTL